jgi:NitT/TauT family transport system substrate-binding protein
LADSLGEFKKENITVDIQKLGFADALPQMAAGRIDVAVGGFEAGWYNAVNSNVNTKCGIGNFFPPDAGDLTKPQTGLWARKDVFKDASRPNIADLKGKSLASAVGNSSVIAYPITAALKRGGLTFNDINVKQIPSPDMVQALQNNAVDSAWLLDPYWLAASKDPNIVLIAGQPPAEPLGCLFFSEGMLSTNKPVAVAFTRAIVRTINTYLDGDYKANPQVLDALSKATSTPPENLKQTPPIIFDWEIRKGTTDRTQEVFITLKSAQYSTPFPEDKLVDRSLFQEAVGRKA